MHVVPLFVGIPIIKRSLDFVQPIPPHLKDQSSSPSDLF